MRKPFSNSSTGTAAPCPILAPDRGSRRATFARWGGYWRKGGIATTAALALLAGCKHPVGPDYSRPNMTAPPAYKEAGAPNLVPPPNPNGGSWTPATPSDGMLKGKWWEVYNDPQLNQYEERIATDNFQVQQALNIYLASRDAIIAARSNYYPRVSAGPGISRDRASGNRPLTTPGPATDYNDFAISGTASWEPDLWGRIRRSVEASRAAAQASAADMANISLSLQAQMASAYFSLRGADAQIQLLESTVADFEKQLDLTTRRRDGGVTTDVDVAQARTQLESVRAQLVDVKVARAGYEHVVGTIANIPLSNFSIPFSPLNGPLPQIPTGLPSQLLERRPDIAAVERRTQAANAQIGIAISAYYPDITLSGTIGFESQHGGTWIQGPSSLWALGAQAAELLFDAGQRHALTSQARHQYEAQADDYKNTVIYAFKDVEDQLSTLRILNDEVTVQQRAVDAAQHSLDLSNQRYRGGVTTYLEVITAETALLNNQRTLTDLKARQFDASVELIRALGGGWDTTQLPK